MCLCVFVCVWRGRVGLSVHSTSAADKQLLDTQPVPIPIASLHLSLILSNEK